MKSVVELQGTIGPLQVGKDEEFPGIDVKVGGDFIQVIMKGKILHAHVRVTEGSLLWALLGGEGEPKASELASALKNLKGRFK